MDTRIKSSFGTALKLYDRRYPYASTGMGVALALAIFLAPSPQMFVEGMSSRPMWTALNERLLPAESWFGLGPVISRLASRPDANDITTGTLPTAPAAPQAGPDALPPAGQ
jgi:hypothetical protein